MSGASIAYTLCALTSLLCAGLLIRSYLARPMRLLLWAALCFIGLAANNVLLFVDLQVLTGVDLRVWRDVTGFAAVSVLLFGLIWEST